jgi:hypothetical protein
MKKAKNADTMRGFGIAIGPAIGLALGSIPIGVPIGLALGLALRALARRRLNASDLPDRETKEG